MTGFNPWTGGENIWLRDILIAGKARFSTKEEGG
jgi:hypothetical protein